MRDMVHDILVAACLHVLLVQRSLRLSLPVSGPNHLRGFTGIHPGEPLTYLMSGLDNKAAVLHPVICMQFMQPALQRQWHMQQARH